MKKTIIIVENAKRIEKQMTLDECVIYYNDRIKTWARKCYESAKKISHNIMDEDDFYSEAMICLMRVYKAYQPINTFTTTLFKSLDNLKADIFKLLNCKKRKSEKRTISLDETYDESTYSKLKIDTYIGYEDRGLKDVELKSDINNIIEKLNVEEKTIFDFLLNKNITKKGLSEKLNVSRPTLNTKIPRVQLKIKNLLPEYLAV